VTAVDLSAATNGHAAAPAALPLASSMGLGLGLPFLGRMDSYQFLGLGRLDVAEALCDGRDFGPVAYGPEKALLQLSFMRWRTSSVGPYCSSFLGLTVAPRRRAARRSPLRPRPRRLPAASLLSAFLQAPPVLFVLAYVVGDAPGGPAGCGAASQQFGRQSLDMGKNAGQFLVADRDGIIHLQALESRRDPSGQTFVTGYSISLTGAAPALGRLGLPLSPSLLSCVPLMATKAAKAMRTPGQQSGAILVDSLARPGSTSHIATRFTTRPRLHDLTADRKAGFAPLILQRPAPADALGCLLERLAFEPVVALRDPEMSGAILGPVPRLEDALA
jgi:hypothetical protein